MERRYGLEFEDLNSMVIPRPLKPTHTLELLHSIRIACKEFDMDTMHYTASGITCIITDHFDGQQYTLTINPVKK